jgi:citrate lyase subunit beta/citryl-CoA lyase
MRSLLLTPGDDEAKLAEALASAAHAVVVDLDVAANRRDAARANVARALADVRAPSEAPALIVRVSSLDSGETDRDLDAIMAAGPFAVMLPRTRGAASVQRLSTKLAVREALNAIEDGATAILAAIDTAEGVLAAASLRGSSARLIGLAWDAAALAAEVGAEATRDGGGALVAPLLTARHMTLFAAAAAGVGAIDTAFAAPWDGEALRAEAVAACRAGFVAKLATDAGQPASINEVFGREKKGES